MNYTSVILNRLIDIYEHRGLFRTADSKNIRVFFFLLKKHFRNITISMMKEHIRKSTRQSSIFVSAGFCRGTKMSGDNTENCVFK